MIHEVNLSLTPAQAADKGIVKAMAVRNAGMRNDDFGGMRFLRRSVDARRGRISINLRVAVWSSDHNPVPLIPDFGWKDVSGAMEVIVVGSGPAGLFAALELVTIGLRPVILERGKDISERKIDVARISREHTVNPDSNYCFGAGGAGTFSDGKLYTRSKKRGDNSRVLEMLSLHGAGEEILYEAHPHIGTDRLPGIITAIRQRLVDSGALFLFNRKVVRIMRDGERVKGVETEGGEIFMSPRVILATGHSARDIYSMLDESGIAVEAKPFAMGVRVEHPQQLIDRIQYHGQQKGEWLPSASYTLATQCGDRGVYSFCMCPGGFIVPAATSPGEVVVNGMSPSHRNSKWANAGIIVETRVEDIPAAFAKHGELSGMYYQELLEQEAFRQGGERQSAPAQRLTDFIRGSESVSLPAVSYFPGVVSSPLHSWLPPFIANRLKEGFLQFDKKMRGFITSEALITGVESRSSSPVRIPRDPETLEHTGVKGLYPAGEGSGYAGGILSSAVDGIRVARAVAKAAGHA
ncbi:MAG: NAD(P)/FAD-dependent oxidoreductase [Bacteroidales bacterium]|nr:NAD(P)/FAD-dependent oxidoreductase [Bacteroidales bacterium]